MIKLRDFTHGKEPKWFLINKDNERESFVYSQFKELEDDIEAYRMTNLEYGDIKHYKKPYQIIDWQIKEGSIRVRKDGKS